MIYSIIENGLIGSDIQWFEPPVNGIVVPDSVFQLLRQFAFEVDQAEVFLVHTIQKGKELIRVRNYVGLMPLSSTIQIEILPKIDSVASSKPLLLSMLRRMRNGPFRTLTGAHTSATELPLWDVFVRAFLDTLEPLIQQGIQRAYITLERNERFWKGKFQLARHQRENACHAERLAVIYEQRTANVAPNRILKTALFYLSHHTHNLINKRRIQQCLGTFDDVAFSESLADDLKAIQETGRLFARYVTALRWAEALLRRQGFGSQTGSVESLSLLFRMERVFENYVAYAIRRYWPDDGNVTLQEASAHLVDEHNGGPKFKLRPDLLIRQQGRTLVIDTKWKHLNGTDRMGNYGIEQDDMYQLYAYGKKYDADDLFLVYPANSTFYATLPVFSYDAITRLHVVPFDLTNSLAKEVEKLANYALSI